MKTGRQQQQQQQQQIDAYTQTVQACNYFGNRMNNVWTQLNAEIGFIRPCFVCILPCVDHTFGC